MNQISRLLQKYQDQTFDEIISNPDLARDLQLINQGMESADDETQENARKFLNDLLGKIEVETNDLHKELDKKSETIDQIEKTKQACLAYSKQKDRKGS